MIWWPEINESKSEKRYKLVVADDDKNRNTWETNRKDSPYSRDAQRKLLAKHDTKMRYWKYFVFVSNLVAKKTVKESSYQLDIEGN